MGCLNLHDVIRFSLDLLLAAFLGGVIGFEREMHGQGAGFRTNILICMSACLMMQLSMNMELLFRHLNQQSVVRLDPARIASYAIASMGFLGAGAIMKSEGSVRGLTTAAGLWLLTGVGLAVGAGFYVPAVITILIAMVVLYGLRKFKSSILKEVHTHITLQVDTRICDFSHIEQLLDEYENLSIEFVNFRRDILNNVTLYDIKLVSKGVDKWREIARQLRQLDGVNEISWTDASLL
ncbi:MAG: MgtC/SapB family protein [Deltaproteobacteria bacterium]|nr:MgtC/SapB family protein [Deltaproteobacteria bacterium]